LPSQQKEFLTAAMDVELHPRSVLACELVADVASNFGQVRIRVTGASMMPAIWPGDVIKVRRCDAGELEPGQIMLYRRDGRLVAHRIIRADGDELTTRGDSLSDEDPPVRRADVMGKVVSLVHSGRVIYPRRSLRLRVWSAILRRSDLCLRMTLRVSRLIGVSGSKELSWSR
jgi:signal peptidase I